MAWLKHLAWLLRSLPWRLVYSQDRVRRYGPGPRLMSALRRWRVLLIHPQADIRFEGPVYLGPGFTLHIPGRGSFIVGPDVEFRHGFRAEIEGEGRITVGAGTVFTYDVLIQCSQSIEIGKGCALGQSTIFMDAQHRFRDTSRPFLGQGFEWHPITIGDDAIIPSKCTVMANVGERAVIGANSVVTRDIPAFCVAAGAPARVLSYFGPPGSEPEELTARSEA